MFGKRHVKVQSDKRLFFIKDGLIREFNNRFYIYIKSRIGGYIN